MLILFVKVASASALSAVPSCTLNTSLLPSDVTYTIRLLNTELKAQHKISHGNAILQKFPPKLPTKLPSCESHVGGRQSCAFSYLSDKCVINVHSPAI